MAETLTDSQILALCAYLNKTVNDTGSTLGPAATSDYLKWHATINSSPMMGMPIETADFAKSIFGRIPRKLLNDLANQGGLTRLEAGGLSLAELIATARSKKSQVTGDEPPQADKPEQGVAVAENGGKILAPRYESAYQSYEHASRKLPPEKQTDQEAYEFLKEYGMPEYELPAYETWERYVREGRGFYGTQKNTPPSGEPGGQ